jgi:DNA uptake protein ComE-like DNA-binding protein
MAITFILILSSTLIFAADKFRQPLPNTAEPTNKSALLDINMANDDQLKTLPGISGDYSDKIIAGRPYIKKEQLLYNKILPEATYDEIKDLIIVK